MPFECSFSFFLLLHTPLFFSARVGERGRGVAVGTLAKDEQFAAVVCAFTFPIMIKGYFLSAVSTIIRDLVVTYAYLCKFISFLSASVSPLYPPCTIICLEAFCCNQLFGKALGFCVRCLQSSSALQPNKQKSVEKRREKYLQYRERKRANPQFPARAERGRSGTSCSVCACGFQGNTKPTRRFLVNHFPGHHHNHKKAKGDGSVGVRTREAAVERKSWLFLD